MTIVTRMVREKMAREAQYQRLQRALKSNRAFVEVPFEWQSKQTAKAVLFPTYGWVPMEAIRWRKADGTIVDWTSGRDGDVFMLAAEFVKPKEDG